MFIVTKDLNIMPRSIYEFHKIQRRKGHTFLMSANKITFTYTTSSASPTHPLYSIYIPHFDKAW